MYIYIPDYPSIYPTGVKNVCVFNDVVSIIFTLITSTWSLATSSELEAGLEQWREKIENGMADEVIAKYEEQRKKIGMTTSIVAYKV